MSWFSFADCRCPDNETTVIYSDENPEEFTTEVNGDPDDSPLTPSGADIIFGKDVNIKPSPFPGCGFRVMALMFTVTPDGDSPVIVTVNFVDLNGGPDVQVLVVSLIS